METPEPTTPDTTYVETETWFQRTAQSIHAQVWLVALSFTESSFFVVPPDPLLAAMVFAKRSAWIRYTAITATASIAGAVFGYILGALLYNTVGTTIIAWYGLQVPMAKAVALVNSGVFVFTLTMAFTPIPFKVAVLAAGFTKANFIAFFVATVVGRIARYVFVAYIARVFRNYFSVIMRQFWWIASGAGGIIIILYAIYRFFW